LIPIEVKSSATPDRSLSKNIESFRKDLGGCAEEGYVVHPGDVTLPLGPDAVASPFSDL